MLNVECKVHGADGRSNTKSEQTYTFQVSESCIDMTVSQYGASDLQMKNTMQQTVNRSASKMMRGELDG